MKFAAFQPYFFPYLGHFDLINSVDLWLVSDNAQYIQYGWINRNRILHPASGWTYMIVPLKAHPHSILIKDVQISQDFDWKERIFGQLAHYRRQAPFFRSTLRLVEQCLEEETLSIAHLNTTILANLCRVLGLNFEFRIASQLAVSRGEYGDLNEYLCALAARLGADEFINPPGGAHLYDARRFAALGVKLTFQNYQNMLYATGRYAYEPALSIIDVLMWNTTGEIKRHLDRA